MDNRHVKDKKRTPTGTQPKDEPVIPDPTPTQPGYDENVEKR